ncbi:MAG: DNA-processing protein DprA [Thermomicrobium sp.]|nr:DNA-processing protein DprA [Thermomicrobium sp.]
MDARVAWVGFHAVEGISLRRLERLVAHYGSVQDAWAAPEAELRALGLPEGPLERLVAARRTGLAQKVLEAAERAGASVLVYPDEGYPPLLREIGSPPLALFVKGSLEPGDARGVALVGTRQASSYGAQVARTFATDFAQAGVTVVSGLARGIDRVAHEAALEAGGRTIAVLGTGIDVVYPAGHRALAERIVERGALVTEFLPGTPPHAGNFPVRNRIISGLSLGVVVVEAPQRSGALITANFALDQNRAVYTVPGPIFSSGTAGILRLLREGATPVGSAQDVLEDLALEARQLPLLAPPTVPEAARPVVAALGSEPRHIDELAAQLGMGIAQLSALLLELQLEGLVMHLGAQHYALAVPSVARGGSR